MAPMDPNHQFDVLILEDDMEFAEMIEELLQTEYTGCQVTKVSDANEILTEIERIAEQGRHFYLVITDYTVLKKIKEDITVEQGLIALLNVSSPKPPVLLMSSADFKTILGEHPDLRQHVDAYLQKPVEWDPFLHKVTCLLNQYCGGMGGKSAN